MKFKTSARPTPSSKKSDSAKSLIQAKGTFAETEKRFQTLFEQSPLSVQLFAVDGSTIAVNASWKKMWNVDEEFVSNFIYKEYNVLSDPVLEKRGISDLVRNAFAGKSVRVAPHFYDPSEVGSSIRGRWLETSLHPIFDENAAVKEVVLIHDDVTEKVEAEAELKRAKEGAETANRLKSSFLANMSHEIRTPLSAMIGYAQLLRTRDLDSDESQRYLEVIERNAMSLAKIIDDILDLSKVEAGRVEIQKVPVNLRLLIDEIGSLLKIKLQARNVAFVVEPFEAGLQKIKTDPLRLRQILINLIGNAAKFTERGTVTVRATSLNNQLLKISVSDTGIGIPNEHQSALFEPFMQVDNTYTRKFSGTGLGLALSKKLAQAMGGDVVLDSSQPEAGSTFSVTLPFEPIVAVAQEESKATPVSPTNKELSGKRILLVDDSNDNRFLVKRILSRHGAILTEAINGREAVELALSGDAEIILMDVQMPVMDGLEATRELRAKGYTKPIIALTAHALEEERGRCLNAGANAHVVKPINFTELVATIRKLTETD